MCLSQFSVASGHKGLFYINGLAQDFTNSIALAMELLQSCIKSMLWLSQCQVTNPKREEFKSTGSNPQQNISEKKHSLNPEDDLISSHMLLPHPFLLLFINLHLHVWTPLDLPLQTLPSVKRHSYWNGDWLKLWVRMFLSNAAPSQVCGIAAMEVKVV